MNYTFINGQEELFVLFHGTGGNEHSLFPVIGELNPYASVLSFLGNVGVGRQRRFFAPLMLGGFVDRQDLARRVNDFLKQWDQMEEVQHKTITLIGYSNGANFILALLEKRPNLAQQVFLLHPSHLGWKFQVPPTATIVATVGASDTLAPAGPIVQLKQEIEQVGGTMNVVLLDGGHAISDQEINLLKNSYQKENKQ